MRVHLDALDELIATGVHNGMPRVDRLIVLSLLAIAERLEKLAEVMADDATFDPRSFKPGGTA